MTGLFNSTKTNGIPKEKINWQSLPVGQQKHEDILEPVEMASQILSDRDPIPPSNRLITIIPDTEFNIFEMTKQIWSIAEPEGRKVLLITKPIRKENNYSSRLKLITLANLIRDSKVTVQTQLISDGDSLVESATRIAQPDDIFVCFTEHKVSGFFIRKSLIKDLARNTTLPIYALKGSISDMTEPISDRMIDIFLLVLSLVSIVGFFALQVWFDRNTSGSFHMILQILSTFVEIWFVAVCSSRSLHL
jgi:hypothetical protein